MIHGFILNAIKFGLAAAKDFPENPSDLEIKELAAWLSIQPNDGTYADFLEFKRYGQRT